MRIRALLRSIWRSRTGPLLVCFQVAIALVVLVNVAYVVTFRMTTTGRDTGIDLDNITWIRTEGYGTDYDHPRTVEVDLRYLKSMPDVISASVVSALPQTFTGARSEVSTQPAGAGTKALSIVYQGSAELADTLGLQMVAGRRPQTLAVVEAQSDQGSAPANLGEIVITRALARSLFDNEEPIGKSLYMGNERRFAVIVGVVEYMQAAPFFGPGSQFVENVVLSTGTPPGPVALYMVRTRPGRRDAVEAEIESRFEATQSQRYVDQIESLSKTAEAARAAPRASALFSAIVAVLVAAVTALGLFGLAAYNVTTRTQQIGTRRALGARKADIVRAFLQESWLIVTSGILIGTLLTLALAIPLTGLLRMARLPLIYLGLGVLAMWLIGITAVVVPARRAASVPPAVATRGI